jgi:hypothetical protein
MAVGRVTRSIEDLLRALAQRIRRLEQRNEKIGNWTITEDRATGDLYAMRYNGQGVPRTVCKLCDK